MRIAFISQEFPPDTGGGGIGTYLAQTTAWLSACGHSIEVFCGAAKKTGKTKLANGVIVHRVAADSAETFRQAVKVVFTCVHKTEPFDVIEGNDFDAPANAIKQAIPQLPYVVKLHTPRFVIDELHSRPPTPWQKWRMQIGAWRQGRMLGTQLPIRLQPPARAEIAALELADEIAAPSVAVAQAAVAWTTQAQGKISVFPYAYLPLSEFLRIPAESLTNRVTYLGRLEERKGVIDLADAIPGVLAKQPKALFRFVGRSMDSPQKGQDMQSFLSKRLSRFAHAVEFTGPVPPDKIFNIMAETDVLVAPSHWESFGLVCCEGMAAARAIIGSNSGGMAEILDNGRYGLLVQPRQPDDLKDLILSLLADPEKRRLLGESGRQRIIDHHTPARILPLQLASYQRAITRCRSLSALPS